MEWVETTGKTIEEAKEAALDELGVDEQDAEFEVLEEPKVGLFGRIRSEGRIRARVRPTTPRAKEDRRDRRRRTKTAGDGDSGGTAAVPVVAEAPAERPTRERAPRTGRSRSTAASIGASRAATPSPGEPAETETAESSTGRPRTNPTRRTARGGGRPAAAVTAGAPVAATSPATAVEPGAAAESGAAADGDGGPAATTDGAARPARARRKRSSANRTSAASTVEASDAEEGTLMDVALDEQGKVAEQFLVGLLDSFGVAGQVVVTVPDDDTIDIQVTGSALGLLIGPKGATLAAIQDLTRTVVQRKTNAGNGRIFIDVAGYRHQRNEALTRFARKVAADAVASQVRIPLEPMSAADRKTVHDAITEVDGVETTSEGEDDRRHVVIIPSAG